MPQKPSIVIVWFKRDLRIEDHAPLYDANRTGLPVLPIYVLEKPYWQLPDTSRRQWDFIHGCLLSLHQSLRKCGQGLCVFEGCVVDIFDHLLEDYDIRAIFSHMETGNDWTFERDKRVRTWCQNQQIIWHEHKQFAIVRGCLNRDDWDSHWERIIQRPLLPAPTQLRPIRESDLSILNAHHDCLNEQPLDKPQQPGRQAALETLDSFLNQRGQYYQRDLSSPLTAVQSCSRLSTYIAYGCLSMTELFTAVHQRRQQLQNMPDDIRPKGWLSSLRSFESRLHWHCHFIQKFETEPRMEFENLLPAMNGLRESAFNEDYFQAWRQGQTGYPFVDACMRALTATGWINFRMRAMLVSFASYQLWLHWPRVAHHLACLFTDYEPGIHYSQIQMQSGTTGINSIRVYNPVKQGLDQDPDAIFIKTWVPELSALDTVDCHTPWETPRLLLIEKDVELGVTYPFPIVDHQATAKKAKAIIHTTKSSAKAKQQANQIYIKHGSRKSRRRRS